MGIRFVCPNGHRLNVKSFLAGERGICPHCNARFVVPHPDEVARDLPQAAIAQPQAIESPLEIIQTEPEPTDVPSPVGPVEEMVVPAVQSSVSPLPASATTHITQRHRRLQRRRRDRTRSLTLVLTGLVLFLGLVLLVVLVT